jgi:hypothetical protein
MPIQLAYHPMGDRILEGEIAPGEARATQGAIGAFDYAQE